MRTMVLELACVDLIELLFQARLLTITTFSLVSTNTGAVSRSDGLHVSFRVVFFVFFCTRKRSHPCRTIRDASPSAKRRAPRSWIFVAPVVINCVLRDAA